MGNHGKLVVCAICHKQVAPREVVRGEAIRSALDELIRKSHPEWSRENMLCFSCLNRFRAIYIASILEKGKGELSTLEKEVVQSLSEQEILARDPNKEFEGELKFGDRLADKIAEFGGSWTFIIIFFLLLTGWILLNSSRAASEPLDPFPYILLNLVLSCLAAIQAPIILMSENRQETRDRWRAENDYRINLKAELEVQHLHLKLDELMTHQWQRLLEIQQIQTDLLEELEKRKH